MATKSKNNVEQWVAYDHSGNNLEFNVDKHGSWSEKSELSNLPKIDGKW